MAAHESRARPWTASSLKNSSRLEVEVLEALKSTPKSVSRVRCGWLREAADGLTPTGILGSVPVEPTACCAPLRQLHQFDAGSVILEAWCCRGAIPPREAFTLLKCPRSALRFQSAQGAGGRETVETAMIDPIRELRTRAEILHRNIQRQSLSAARRLRSLEDYRAHSNERLLAAAPSVRRHECLNVLAIELGFEGWTPAVQAIGGKSLAVEYGAMLYPARCGGHLNLWYRSHTEAEAGRRACRGYLLGYRRQCFVVQAGFIEALGLDPTSPEWHAMGFDWVRPADLDARTRLYGELVRQLPAEGGRS